MDKWFKIKIRNKEIEWRDGKFTCPDEDLLNKIHQRCDLIAKTGCGVNLEGHPFTGCLGWSPEKTWETAYCMLEDMSGCSLSQFVIDGDYPTWEKLGLTLEDGQIS